MDSKEKKLLIAMVVLLAMLMVKSVFIDPYTPENQAQVKFYDEVEAILDISEDSWLYDSKLVTTRVVKMKKMTDKERTVKVEGGDAYVATGIYKAKVRKYVLGIIPFSDKYILDID